MAEKRTQITVTRNKELNGIEIRFPENPGQSVTMALTHHGFRWSPKGKYWWSKYSETREAFAKFLTGPGYKGGD